MKKLLAQTQKNGFAKTEIKFSRYYTFMTCAKVEREWRVVVIAEKHLSATMHIS